MGNGVVFFSCSESLLQHYSACCRMSLPETNSNSRLSMRSCGRRTNSKALQVRQSHVSATPASENYSTDNWLLACVSKAWARLCLTCTMSHGCTDVPNLDCRSWTGCL